MFSTIVFVHKSILDFLKKESTVNFNKIMGIGLLLSIYAAVVFMFYLLFSPAQSNSVVSIQEFLQRIILVESFICVGVSIYFLYKSQSKVLTPSIQRVETTEHKYEGNFKMNN